MYIPGHAARTSERRRLMSGVRYLLTSLRIQLISCSSAMGLCDILQGESVVPAIVLPCHGRKKYDPTVRSRRIDETHISRAKISRQHNVHSQTWCNDFSLFRLIHLLNSIDKWSCGIDYAFGTYHEFVCSFVFPVPGRN